MSWLTRTLTTSIGKKLLMALTGFGFIGFLVGHLIGNFTIYGGKGSFNAYAEHLHSLEPVVKAVEAGLIILALVHISIGLILFVQNLNARPQAYAMKKRAGGRTLASQFMPYTGFGILLFVILHLINFTLADKTGTTIFDLVMAKFSNPGYVLLYVLAMVLVGLHIRHGFWSLFQTLGANHPKYMPFIMKTSIVLGLVFGLGFGLIPLYLLLLV